ncbi:MAG: AsmA family protein [Alphaproteobacteria bacterium]|nr:AsmA family protein [Alphaproteobacteria bacterium]
MIDSHASERMDDISKWKWHLVGGLAALGLLFPWPIVSETLRHEIEDHLQNSLGMSTQIKGSILISLLPRPSMQIEGIELSDPDKRFTLASESLNGPLDLLPLFGGRFEISDLALDETKLTLDLDSLNMSNLSAPPAPAQAALQSPPRQISFDNLSLTLTSAQKPKLSLEHLNGTLDWRGLDEPVNVQMRGQWQNANAGLSLRIGSPNNLRNGLTTSISLDVTSPKLAASFKGETAFGNSPKMDGKVSFSTASLRDLLAPYGIDPGLPGPLQKFALTSQMRSNGQTLSFEQASLKADGNVYEGTLALTQREGKTILSGTLATDQLTLTPLIASLPDVISADGAWSREDLLMENVALADKRAMDLDLRLSASQARLYKLQIKNAGMALKASDGQIDFALFDALSGNGHLKGRLNAARHSEGLQMRLSATLQDLESGKFLGDVLRANPLLGTLNGQINVETNGRDVASLMQALTGTLEMDIDNGDVIGIDLDQALRRSEKRPLSVPLEIRRGRTSFTKAKISAHCEGGFLVLDTAHATGFNLASSLEGRLSFVERNFALRLSSLQTLQDGTPKPDAQRLLLDLSGPWDAPRIDFDFDSLIRRSEAAAPLLSLTPAKAR